VDDMLDFLSALGELKGQGFPHGPSLQALKSVGPSATAAETWLRASGVVPVPVEGSNTGISVRRVASEQGDQHEGKQPQENKDCFGSGLRLVSNAEEVEESQSSSSVQKVPPGELIQDAVIATTVEVEAAAATVEVEAAAARSRRDTATEMDDLLTRDLLGDQNAKSANASSPDNGHLQHELPVDRNSSAVTPKQGEQISKDDTSSASPPTPLITKITPAAMY